MRLSVPLRLTPTRRSLSTAKSIFSPNFSPWDEIFDDIKHPAPPPRSLNSHPTRRDHAQKHPRAIAMTHSETRIFDQMFNAIFPNPPANPSADTAIGQHRTSPFYRDLRQGFRRHWTTEADEELDQKKEEMDLCESDLQLLEWAMREVFGESQRYESAARRAAQEPSQTEPSSPSRTRPDDPLQPLSYPHLLAALMRTFREKYGDPHLALAMFDHARNLSIASYAFGCTTPAYNELIETRWLWFRDVRGVCDALQEMRVNGVPMDSRTRLLAEKVRREIGQRTLWQEDVSFDSGEVWKMVARIERLAMGQKSKRSKGSNQSASSGNMRKRRRAVGGEEWKRNALDVDAKDDWGFDKWVNKSSRSSTW